MTQAEALAILKTGGNVFLTGEPGSGKTHTLNRYVAYLRSRGIEPAITASTGIAATHIGGVTIHSWSGIGVKSVIGDEDIDYISQNERVVKRILGAKVLVIDEISMLSADTLHSVDRVCRGLRQRDEPFGGVQVVLVGDFFQLPPVVRPVPGDEETLFFDPDETPKTPFAFRSPAWREAQFLICYLSEQHRQEDGRYLETLSAIRRGDVSDSVRECLRERCVSAPAGGITKLFPHNANVDRLNDGELSKIAAEAKTFLMTGTGAPFLIEALKRNCISPETLILKIGAKVMFTKNSVEGRYVNGTTGEVIGFSKAFNYPLIKIRGGRTVEAEPEEWSVTDGQKPIAMIKQIPLRLAWAITVHKSQGMSLDAAAIDLSSAFEYGQGYVALSRVRTLGGLYLSGFNQRALEVHPEVAEADESFRAGSTAARSSFAAMLPDDLTRMHANFIRALGGREGASPIKMKQKKAQKVSTLELTRELLRKKISLSDIARERGITERTIVSHIEELAASKKIEPKKDCVHLLAGKEAVVSHIHAVFAVLGSAPLKPVFDRLGQSISYETIRLARLLWAESSSPVDKNDYISDSIRNS